MCSWLLEDGDIESGKEYLLAAKSKTDDCFAFVHTGCSALNFIVNTKLTAAQKVGIKVQAEIAEISFSDISDLDLCGMLGNMLDNAIEASERESGERQISLEIKTYPVTVCLQWTK